MFDDAAGPVELRVEQHERVLVLQQEQARHLLVLRGVAQRFEAFALGFERGDAALELVARIFGVEQRQEGKAGAECREFARGLGEQRMQPRLPGRVSGFGQRVQRALGKRAVALGIVHGDQPVAQQPVDRLVEARALPHVDDFVVTAGLQLLQHPVRMHRRFGERREDRERKRRRATRCHE